MLYKTLKVAAGRHSFDIGQELEFNDAEAAALLADGAITPLTPSETLAAKLDHAGKRVRGKHLLAVLERAIFGADNQL